MSIIYYMYVEERRRLAPRRSVPKRAPSPLPPAPNQPLPKIPEQPKLEEINSPTSPSPKTESTKGGDSPSSILSVANIPETSIDQAEADKTELPSCSESERHDDTSLTETTLDQGISHEVHEDLKAEIRRDLQASRSIFTALFSPTVMSLIQSSFPQFGRPCKSGREESKVVTSPVTLGYVPSMTSTVREGQEDAGASSGGGGRSMLKCGAVSDQIVYPSALRSNPITLSRGLKVVQSDSPTPKTTSTPIAPVDEVSVAEEIVQEQKPLEGSDITNAAVSDDTFGKEEYLETQDDQQGADDKDASSNSSLPPPRPQRPEVSIDLDFLMSVFQSQLIAREQSWLERSAELEQIAEKDPSKRDGTSTSTSENNEINPPKTCLHTPPPTSQCPEEMPTPRNSSSAPAPLTPRTSSLPKDRTLVRKTPPPPSSSPASCSESLVTSPEMDLQNRQLRLEQDVQHLMDVLTGHAHVQAQRSHLHLCHAGRCNHAHHHPRYYSMDGSEHVNAEEDENEQDQEASMGTLPRHIEELQHHAMHAPGYHKQKKPQPLMTPLSLRAPTLAKGDRKKEVRAEILEESGPAIETSVLSTITTTTAHTTVIEVPMWDPTSASSSLTAPPVPPLVSRSDKKKRPVLVPLPQGPLASSTPSTPCTPHTPRPLNINNTNNNNKDDITLRRIAQLQHSHHETQVLHEQLDQFWDRLQTVESSQRAGLWQERYHDLHERLLDMEFWKRSISGNGASGSSKHKDGKK